MIPLYEHIIWLILEIKLPGNPHLTVHFTEKERKIPRRVFLRSHSPVWSQTLPDSTKGLMEKNEVGMFQAEVSATFSWHFARRPFWRHTYVGTFSADRVKSLTSNSDNQPISLIGQPRATRQVSVWCEVVPLGLVQEMECPHFSLMLLFLWNALFVF